MTSSLILLLPAATASDLLIRHRGLTPGQGIPRSALNRLGQVKVPAAIPLSLLGGSRLLVGATAAPGEGAANLQALFPGLPRLQQGSWAAGIDSVGIIALAPHSLQHLRCVVTAAGGAGAPVSLLVKSVADEHLLQQLHGQGTQPRLLLLGPGGTVLALLDGYYTAAAPAKGGSHPGHPPPPPPSNPRIVPPRRVAPRRGPINSEKLR